MINPNGDDFVERDPLDPSAQERADETFSTAKRKLRQTAGDFSEAAGDTLERVRQQAGTARERTEFFLRENPVPTVLGALMIGLAIGLAIRYASSSSEKEVEVKSPLGHANLGALAMPFLWPFFKTVKRKYDDSNDALKEGVDRLREIDVDRYVKPLRKRWKAWTN